MKYISRKLSAAQARLLKQKMKCPPRSIDNAAQLPQIWTRLVLVLVAFVPFVVYLVHVIDTRNQAFEMIAQRNRYLVNQRLAYEMAVNQIRWRSDKEVASVIEEQLDEPDIAKVLRENIDPSISLVQEQAEQDAEHVAQGVYKRTLSDSCEQFAYNDCNCEVAFWESEPICNFIANVFYLVRGWLGLPLFEAYSVVIYEITLNMITFKMLSAISPAFNMRVSRLTAAIFEYSIVGQSFKTMPRRLSYKNFRSNRL